MKGVWIGAAWFNLMFSLVFLYLGKNPYITMWAAGVFITLAWMEAEKKLDTSGMCGTVGPPKNDGPGGMRDAQ